ncbi:DUF305 domain-containing protein [Actinopolyspora mortivallis]|uniref:DUF305 domain-containing protein n=1 Tax=Actinopolyspora mortivallis TaxID=33906 RepID=UPI0003634BC6|nr:DUF305 domain-containing protein [Actinopolyspora mortivallis]
MSGGEATVRTSTIIGVLGAAVLALTGCSPNYEEASEQSPAPGTPPPPSAIVPAKGEEKAEANIDLEFARQMKAYHRAEEQLVEIALNNSAQQRVTEFAEQLEQHGQYLERIDEWLAERQEGGADSGEQHTWMPETDVAGEITELEEAPRGEFATLWVKAMIDHHDAVLEMTDTEIERGSDQQLRSIARQIRDSRQQELDELKQLREQL